MATLTQIDLQPIADELGFKLSQVENLVQLLDDNNTVPFIARYRKDQTLGMDEEQVRQVQDRVNRERLLRQRMQTILRTIESQGKLTPELKAEIEAADSVKRLEDLYLPYKPKKTTLATLARERGLLPLADEILDAAETSLNLDGRAGDFVNPDKQVPTVADALLGAGHIIAERFSERADVRGRLRDILRSTGKLVSTKANDSVKPGGPFQDYFNFAEPLTKIPNHRVLAINRGERAKALRVHVAADEEAMIRCMEEMLVPADHPHRDFLQGCARDALQRLIYPSLEREARRELTEAAEAHAVQVFARNLRNLLLQPPIRNRRVLAIDPGFRSGCKLVALDEFGNYLAHGVIHLVGKKERLEEQLQEARRKLAEMVKEHQASVIVIGNGTACRETEALVAQTLAEELAGTDVAYTIVNEAGASVYSASPIGREEFPQLDATVRGAISIGRRLQDPLSELVKIEPANIGVGMYQHDVKAKHLQASLDDVVASCVNFVGVDLNTASYALLRYVSGLNQLTARRVFEHRTQSGPFRSREELKNVPGLGESAFVQAAGFLRIADGENPLDATWIHPESYEIAERLLAKLGFGPAQLRDKSCTEQIAAKVKELDIPALVEELGVGELTLRDVIAQLVRPGRDPREDLPAPLFKREILKLEDLEPGMELAGSVLNVVDFGAFVDIGLKDSGLVHISQMSTDYVTDPHQVVAVGSPVRIWVLAVDKERRRVSLTMIPPGTEKAPPPRRKRSDGEHAGQSDGRSGERRAGKPAGAGKPGGDRRPHAGARKGGRKGERVRGAARPKSFEVKSKLPPPKLTKGMKEGKEPLRTFGDLLQFFQEQDPKEDDDSKK